MAAGATVSGGGGGDMSEVDGLQLKCNQVSCGWWRADHVTTLLISHWSG